MGKTMNVEGGADGWRRLRNVFRSIRGVTDVRDEDFCWLVVAGLILRVCEGCFRLWWRDCEDEGPVSLVEATTGMVVVVGK